MLRNTFAREIATSFDWDAEWRRFEQRAESEVESYLPSIAFSDNAGRTLEFGPNSDDTFWVSYYYSTIKSTFGFCPVAQDQKQHLEICELQMALGLVDRHYDSKHLDIVSALPAPEFPSEENN